MIEYVKIADRVCEGLLMEGGAVVDFEGGVVQGCVVNVTGEAECLVVPYLRPKKLRAWFWEQRKARAWRRGNGVVWAAKVGEEVVVGFGALVGERVGLRVRGDLVLMELASG